MTVIATRVRDNFPAIYLTMISLIGKRLAAERRRNLAQLEAPVRLVGCDDGE